MTYHSPLLQLEFQASPLSISVVPSSPSATTTTLEPGSSQSIPAMLANASARQTLQLRIVTRDQYDNAITSGGYAEDLFLTVDGLGGAFKEDLELADNQNGSYTATFVPPTIGVYTFSLFVDDVLVRTNQSLEYTDRGEVVNVPTDPAQSIATGQGIAGSRAGVPAEFAISVRDANGKDKDKAGHDDCPSDDACSISVLIEPVSPTNDYGVELETLEPPVQSDLAQPGRYTVTYTLANFGRYTMAVKIVDQHIQGSPFELTIDKEIAPAPSFASFSATATSLSVSFYDNDRTTLVSTNRGSLVGLDDCTKVFIPTTVAAFGASATCSFRTPFELVVYLGAGATVEPSTVLQLQSDFTPDRPGIINGRLTSGRVRGAIVVEYPDVAPRPTLVLRAPRVISTCDDLLIDATGSYGASGRTLRFAWGMLPNVPNEGTISDTLAAASATATQSSVLIPGSDLAPDIPYTFYVEVRNFLDTFSQQAFTVVRSSVPVPRLIVEGDTVLRVYRSQHVYIPVTVSIPDATGGSECRLDLAGAKMTYEWSFDQTQSVRVTFPLDEATRRSRVLYIPPGTLQAGQTYFLRVEGRVEGRPELSAEAVAIVQAKYEDLLVRLDMPSEITTEDDLTLSTALSVDPNDPTLPGEPPVAPFGPFLFSWQCNPVIDGIAQSTLACFDDVNGVLAPPPESFSITVPAGTLDVGEYEFTVTATKEPLVGPEGPLNRTRDIRKRIVVVPVPEAAEGEAAAVRKPIVNIDPLDRNVVNASDKLILSARLVVAYPDLTWSGEQKAVYFKQQMEAVDWEWVVAQGVLDVTDYPDTVSTSYLSPTLSISPNALAPGETYKFQLKATHRETGLVGQDEVEFQVNGAPTSGECGVNRNTGVAARDRFEFACNGWEDESLEALTYELLYEDPQSGDLIPLVPLSRSNVLADIYIPPVTRGMASDELVVHAVVSDFFGARTTVLLPISITMPSAQAAIADLVCSEAEDIMPGCPCGSAGCVQRYDGEPALVLDLMGDELALAEATNNVPSLITLAKSAAMLFNAWRTDLEATATAVISKASNEEPLNPEEQALYDKYSRGLLLSGIVASRLLASINRVGQTVQLSQKDLDLFGDALRELMRDEQVLDTGAASSAISVAVSRTSSVCVQPTGAQGILEAMSAVDGAVSSQSQGQIQAAATARRLAARRALLSGGLDAVEHSRRWLQQEIEASAEINKNLTNNYSNQAQLMNALACNLTPGEAGFGLSSKNIQVTGLEDLTRVFYRSSRFSLPLPIPCLPRTRQHPSALSSTRRSPSRSSKTPAVPSFLRPPAPPRPGQRHAAASCMRGASRPRAPSQASTCRRAPPARGCLSMSWPRTTP